VEGFDTEPDGVKAIVAAAKSVSSTTPSGVCPTTAPGQTHVKSFELG
jgi:hypothetical protein